MALVGGLALSWTGRLHSSAPGSALYAVGVLLIVVGSFAWVAPWVVEDDVPPPSRPRRTGRHARPAAIEEGGRRRDPIPRRVHPSVSSLLWVVSLLLTLAVLGGMPDPQGHGLVHVSAALALLAGALVVVHRPSAAPSDDARAQSAPSVEEGVEAPSRDRSLRDAHHVTDTGCRV